MNAADAGLGQREPELAGQTVVVVGGSAGIGPETARRARAEGAKVIITARNPGRFTQAAKDVGAERAAACDATDSVALAGLFESLPAPINHVMATGGGPTYGPLLEMDSAQVRDALSDHVVLDLEIAERGPEDAAWRNPLAMELAPLRVNLIAAGFVDTPLSASLLGDQLEHRRQELRATLPIGRAVTPADVAAACADRARWAQQHGNPDA
jgi:NAD(P)-dependent dehydrogenase (short-subunit alcohol dehydrogenase family)